MDDADSAAPSADNDVEGIDRGPVTTWLTQEIPGATAPFTFELIAGGRSNLTYRVTDATGQTFALRRPPVSHVLATAHDMAREHTIISAVAPAGVPVPTPLGLCRDIEVNGAPFYVMEFVEGHILRDEAASAQVSEAVRAHACDSLIDTLAQLHEVDVDAVGLGEFARKEGYIARQLKRWHGQFTQSTLDGQPGPAVIDRTHELLAAKIPEQQGATIVHGDYRLDNTVLDDEGNVVAILDWEICTLGDPLADLGLLLTYWAEPDDEMAALGVAPTALPGFATRAQLVDRYAAASGRDVSQVAYYQAFGIWKLACILQGVYVRYAGGAAAGDRSGVEQFASGVERLGEQALSQVESL
jgi:aminoglycoside phosphotransferase (APT) family kinase protein